MAKSGKPTAPPAESVDAERVLAFVNTLSGRPTDSPSERLVSYDALVDWGREQHPHPSPAVLATIGNCLAAAYAHGRLVPHEGGLQWIASAEDDLERILWEIGRATGRLVVSTRLGRIRSCSASDCGWWFVDETKNRSR